MIIKFKRHIQQFGINNAYDIFLSPNGILTYYFKKNDEVYALDGKIINYIYNNIEAKIYPLSFRLTYNALITHLKERIKR